MSCYCNLLSYWCWTNDYECLFLYCQPRRIQLTWQNSYGLSCVNGDESQYLWSSTTSLRLNMESAAALSSLAKLSSENSLRENLMHQCLCVGQSYGNCLSPNFVSTRQVSYCRARATANCCYSLGCGSCLATGQKSYCVRKVTHGVFSRNWCMMSQKSPSIKLSGSSCLKHAFVGQVYCNRVHRDARLDRFISANQLCRVSQREQVGVQSRLNCHP